MRHVRPLLKKFFLEFRFALGYYFKISEGHDLSGIVSKINHELFLSVSIALNNPYAPQQFKIEDDLQRGKKLR